MRAIGLAVLLLGATLLPAAAQERTVDPTFLRRFLPTAREQTTPISSPAARYKPLFGEGDAGSRTLRAVTRFGELSVDRGGRSGTVSYPREENILVVLDGEGSVSYGGADNPVRANDYVYLPAGIPFGLNASTGRPIRAILMGFAIPAGMAVTVPPRMMKANIDDVPLVKVDGHPNSTLYRLMMGDTKSTRDTLSTGHLMISLFAMEFAPEGTNFPHHHEAQEEIYLMLDGTGEIVAGGGSDGVEGRFPARPGDAYYYRPNTTVGFYNSKGGRARILAVRNNLPPAK